MKKNIIFGMISGIVSIVTFVTGFYISRKKVEKKIKKIGTLNVINLDNSCNPELYLQFDSDSFNELEQTKYAVFELRFVEKNEEKVQKIDA